jgi:hypothetical protein
MRDHSTLDAAYVKRDVRAEYSEKQAVINTLPVPHGWDAGLKE